LKERAASATPSRVLLALDNVDRPNLLEPAQIQQLPQAEWLSLIATTRLGEHELRQVHFNALASSPKPSL
jgi:hypothetical protein